MKLGSGIAIAGIWLGVGLAAFAAGEAIIMIALCAAGATFFVAIAD